MSDNHPVPYPAALDRLSPVPEGEGPHRPAEASSEAEGGGGGGLPIAAILSAWRRRWLLATAVGLLLAGTVAPIIWWHLPVKYNVYTLLRVLTAEPRVLSTPGGGGGANEANELFRHTQTVLVRTRPVLLTALRQENVQNLSVVTREEDPATWLEKNVKVGFLEGTEILQIGMTGEDAEELSVLVSAIEQAYMQETLTTYQSQRVQKLQEIERIINESQKKIVDNREELRKMGQELKRDDTQAPTVEQKQMLEVYFRTAKELADVRADMRRTRGVIAVQEGRLKSLETAEFSDIVINDRMSAIDEVQKLAVEVREMDKVYEDAKRKAMRDRDLAGYKRSLDASIEKLKKVREKYREHAVEGLRKKAMLEAQEAIDSARIQLAFWEGEEKTLEATLKSNTEAVEAAGVTSIKMEVKRSEIDQADGVIKSLRSEKELLKVELQSTAKRVSRLSPDGTVYKVKDTKSRLTRAGAGGASAFFLGSVLVVLWEFSRRRIHSSNEVVRDLRLKVLGTLPGVPVSSPSGPGGAGGRRYGLSQHLWDECVTGLRATLLVAQGGPRNVLMITSAGSREGKTTLAAHLASSIAATGRKTVLVDFDLRRPILHRVFGMTKTPGLSEILRGEAETAAAILPTMVSGLFVLPAGQVDRAALLGLSRDCVRTIFEELKASFDCVVVDTSPVLPVADTLLIGQHVDGVLLVVRPSVSRLPRVRAACERLSTLKARFVGTVVNGGHEHVDADDYRYLAQG